VTIRGARLEESGGWGRNTIPGNGWWIIDDGTIVVRV
jgi:hypothetical protein